MMLYSFLRFQLSWWSALYWAQGGTPLFFIVSYVIQLGLFSIKIERSRLIPILLKCISISTFGYLLDSLAQYLQIIQFQNPMTLAPIWLALMWLAFSTYFVESLGWMLKRPLWHLLVLGFVGFTISYLPGQRLGLLGFADHTKLIEFGLLWALGTPGIVVISRYFGHNE